MGSTLRIIFAQCFALFLLSGCSLFNDTVENCEEPQEYQESVSIPPLVVPKYLKNIQNKSNFNIPKIQGGNAFAEENFVIPMASAKSQSIAEQNNQMGIIEGDELSELLQLIDQTISNRQVGGQFQPIYENITSDHESNPSLEPCLDGPPTGQPAWWRLCSGSSYRGVGCKNNRDPTLSASEIRYAQRHSGAMHRRG